MTEDGTFIVAEQLGDGGVAWNFICFEGETFIELFMFDDVTPNTNNANFLVAVDQQQPLRVEDLLIEWTMKRSCLLGSI